MKISENISEIVLVCFRKIAIRRRIRCPIASETIGYERSHENLHICNDPGNIYPAGFRATTFPKIELDRFQRKQTRKKNRKKKKKKRKKEEKQKLRKF